MVPAERIVPSSLARPALSARGNRAIACPAASTEHCRKGLEISAEIEAGGNRRCDRDAGRRSRRLCHLSHPGETRVCRPEGGKLTTIEAKDPWAMAISRCRRHSMRMALWRCWLMENKWPKATPAARFDSSPRRDLRSVRQGRGAVGDYASSQSLQREGNQRPRQDYRRHKGKVIKRIGGIGSLASCSHPLRRNYVHHVWSAVDVRIRTLLNQSISRISHLQDGREPSIAAFACSLRHPSESTPRSFKTCRRSRVQSRQPDRILGLRENHPRDTGRQFQKLNPLTAPSCYFPAASDARKKTLRLSTPTRVTPSATD